MVLGRRGGGKLAHEAETALEVRGRRVVHGVEKRPDIGILHERDERLHRWAEVRVVVVDGAGEGAGRDDPVVVGPVGGAVEEADWGC